MNWLKNLLAFCLFSLGFSSLYYFVIVRPKNDMVQIENEKAKIELQKRQIDVDERKLQQEKELKQIDQAIENNKATSQEAEKQLRSEQLQKCIEQASKAYLDVMEYNCPGYNNASENNPVICKSGKNTGEFLNDLGKLKDKSESDCYKKYPQN